MSNYTPISYVDEITYPYHSMNGYGVGYVNPC